MAELNLKQITDKLNSEFTVKFASWSFGMMPTLSLWMM